MRRSRSVDPTGCDTCRQPGTPAHGHCLQTPTTDLCLLTARVPPGSSLVHCSPALAATWLRSQDLSPQNGQNAWKTWRMLNWVLQILFFLSLFHYLFLIISFYYYLLFIIIILFYFDVWQAQALPCPCKASVTHRSTAWSLSTRRRLSLQLGARYKRDNQRSKSTLNPKLS